MMTSFVTAIAIEEGFYRPGSRANRNNNPGNIEFDDFARAHGATRLEVVPAGIKEEARFAYFPSAAVGFAALKALFQVPAVFKVVDGVQKLVEGYAGATVEEAIYRYAPPDDNNNSYSYVRNICMLVGCQPHDSISPLVEVDV